ncbi:MAG: tetratricopeptide repeat protein [Candidatus Omnitrophota bacterium]
MKKNKRSNNKNTLAYFEIEFYEKLLKDNPDYVDALIPLAEAYTKAGQYSNGLLVDKQLAKLKPEDAIVQYNLSCSYCLLQQLDEAFVALKSAITLGYNDFHHLDSDPDLFYLREDRRYKEMISDFVKQKGVKNGMGRAT